MTTGHEPQGTSAWTLVILGALACLGVALASGTHIGLVLIVLPVVIALTWQSPRMMLAVLPVWMVMLGLVRRLTPGGGNITFSGDPVLIIGPIIIILLFLTAVGRGAFDRRTKLSGVVAAFCLLALVQALNPSQRLLTGLGGLLFILVPMLAFWIGRALVDKVLALQLVRTVAVLSFFAAIYGLIQQFHGLPGWDRAWITTKGYNALSLGSNVIRAFGSFSSAEEYAAFLSVGLVAWLALSGKGTRMFPPVHVGATITVAVALWFESERTAVFLTVLAIGVMVAARMHLRPYGVLAGGVGAVLLLIFVGGHFGGGGGGGGVSSTLSGHQVSGIAHPFGASSSLSGHIRATRIGILQAFKHPFGHGTGSVTIAANRYGHSRTVGTEFDPGNMGIAFGVLGLAVYVSFAFYAIKTTYRAAVVRRDAVSIFGLGMLMATLFQWTNGDLYAVCWLIWLFVGYLDVTMAKVDAEAALVPVVVEAPPDWRRPGPPRHRAMRE
ncbi:MAG TPA: hypothetical protein VGZ03_02770 [Acidimicrobiales bacterium]|nr:hypothetical protein [Acidimicrobiales bacterium]